MAGRLLDGRSVSAEIQQRIKQEVERVGRLGVTPSLATVMVGDNPASKAYLNNKHKACNEAGIRSQNLELPAQTSQTELEHVISRLGNDETVTGILLQLPLTKGLDDSAAIASIPKEKDVDGLHPYNLGVLASKEAKLAPCTPSGVIVLLDYYSVAIAGSHAVVINRSKLVGRPLAQLLLNRDATVTVCHSKTRDLQKTAREADILVTGIGRRAEFTVTGDMIKAGGAVVDVGISTIDGKLVGDVDTGSALQVASWVSPVPGGVGPMTIAMLLYNTLLTACLQRGVELSFSPSELRASGNP